MLSEEQQIQEQLIDREELIENSEDEDIRAEQEREIRLGQPQKFPEMTKADTVHTLMKEVLISKDNTKTGNLNTTELGACNFSVRSCKYLAILGRQRNHQVWSTFWDDQAQMQLATSASKKGWFVELFVTLKKFSQRILGEQNNDKYKTKSSWGFGSSEKAPQLTQ